MIAPQRPLLLGSASPRRLALLQGLGIPVAARPSNLDEAEREAELPHEYVERMAAEKLGHTVRHGLEGYAGALAADTIVVLDGLVLGKPRGLEEAASLVARLQGRTHRVMTSYAIAAHDGEVVARRVVCTDVTLRRLSEDEARRYAKTGEGLDKAGGYAAQGIGAFLVERLHGSYTNVVGLPVCEVVMDLQNAGLLGPYP